MLDFLSRAEDGHDEEGEELEAGTVEFTVLEELDGEGDAAAHEAVEEADMDAEPGEYTDEEGYGEGSAEGLELHSDEDVAALTEDELAGPRHDVEAHRAGSGSEALEPRGGADAGAPAAAEQGGAGYDSEPQRLQHGSKDLEMRGSGHAVAHSEEDRSGSGRASTRVRG